MLAAVGFGTIEELFAAQIPTELAAEGPLPLGEGASEQEVEAELVALAQRNRDLDQEISFLGGGFYDHYVPAFIEMVCARSEFLTPYTPYQPEVSQGTLQATFEFQSAICALTGMEVANASVYDGPSALAAAAYLAKLDRGPGRIIVSAGLHPHALQAVATQSKPWGCSLIEVELDPRSGRTDPERLADALSGRRGEPPVAVLLAQPNFYGVVEDLVELCRAARAVERPPLVAVSVDPLTLGVLAPPGDCGADIAVGEGQPLGGAPSFGGPSFGFFAARLELLRRMPGRIAGETVDLDGRRGFVLALQTREQHIRRERATSNICTAQALNAFAGLLYLAWLGPAGIRELGELLLARAHHARELLCGIPGVEPLFGGPVFREFALRVEGGVGPLRRHCRDRGVNPGLDLERITGRAHDRGGLLVAISERRTRAQIERLAELVGEGLGSKRTGLVEGALAR